MPTATLSPTNTAAALPKGWKWMTLGEVAQTTSGGTPTTGIEEYYNGSIPWVKSGDLNNGYLNSCQDSITELGLANSSAKLFKPGTLLIALYGATIGRISILNFEAATNQAVCGISPSKNLDVKFLFYYLLCIRQKLIDQGQGGAQPNINQRIVRETPIPIPPLPVQRVIAARLDAQLSLLDATANKLKTLQKKLKRYRQALLKAAVTGELTRRWRETQGPAVESAPALLERILRERRKAFCGRGKYAEPQAPDTAGLPALPEGWCWARLDSIANVGSGMSVSSGRKYTDPINVAYLRVANVQRGFLDLSEIKYMDLEKDKLSGLSLQYGDILFNEGGDIDKLGRGWIWESQISPCITQNHVFRATPYIKNKAHSRFISHWGNTFGKEFFLNEGSQTTNLASINKAVLRKFPIPLPPLMEQQRIVAELEHRFALLDRLESQINHNLKRTDALKQAALKKAFGIQVCQADVF